jgi:hypothetical protein
VPDHTKREQLIEELAHDGEEFFSSGRLNNIIDLSLSITTVLASLCAAGLAAKGVAAWVIAIVAAVPAATTSIQKITGVRKRSNWNFIYAAQVRSLATRLEYAESATVEEIANDRARLEIDMEMEWAKLGSPAESSTQPHKKNSAT